MDPKLLLYPVPYTARWADEACVPEQGHRPSESFLAEPLALEAQPAGKIYHVGLLGIGSGPTWGVPWKPFIELSQKYVELLREVIPSASRFAVVVSPPNPVPEMRRELEAAGRVLAITLSLAQVSGPDDFDGVLARAKRDGAAGIIATGDPVTWRHRKSLVQLALKHRLPGIYWTREYVDDRGLMTYSASMADLRRRAATYVDKILKGAKPADLPVEQPTKFELVVNLKTAKALGLTIPQSVLLWADEIIQ